MIDPQFGWKLLPPNTYFVSFQYYMHAYASVLCALENAYLKEDLPENLTETAGYFHLNLRTYGLIIY